MNLIFCEAFQEPCSLIPTPNNKGNVLFKNIYICNICFTQIMLRVRLN